MGVAELRVVLIAISNLPNANVPEYIDLDTDSSIAIGSLQHGYSPSERINEEVSNIHNVCRRKNYIFGTIRYVPTDKIRADPLSRAVATFLTITDSTLVWVWDNTQFEMHRSTWEVISTEEQ
jgi:hypothetical protein